MENNPIYLIILPWKKNLTYDQQTQLIKSNIIKHLNINELELIRQKNQAIEIISPKKLNVSLTHKENLAIMAITDQKIGIDLEKITFRNLSSIQFAKRWFHHDELNLLKDLYSSVRIKAFYHLWTAKESLSKLLNLPLLEALKIPIALNDKSKLIQQQKNFSIELYRIKKTLKVKLSFFHLKSDYLVCLANTNHHKKLVCLNFDQLVIE